MNPKMQPIFSSSSDLEEKETLSVQKLNNLIGSNKLNDNFPRPAANFIDLMNWTVNQFSGALKDQKNINKFVHNRILIDGQFLNFCEENNITVECLFKDSIISWKTTHQHESFFMQGVFLIKGKGLEFLQAALYHKGNQNEDEISFFILCSEKNYDAYIALRNKFDNWIKAKDRSNLFIHVVDGEDLPYTKDNSWNDLFLPDDIKSKIKELVENFLSSKDFYVEKKIPWKRGFLLYGQPGCGKTSIIRTIISEYNFKPVTIVPGANDDTIREAFHYAEEQSPSLLYFEDLDSLLEKNVDISSFLNLMDGISAKNGLLIIATANDVRKFKPNITQRPSRFDRKFEIPLPNQEMAYIYLQKWFGKILGNKKCNEIAQYAEENGMSYAYLKELYISTMFEALSNNRKIPSAKDIDTTLSRLIKDKNLLNNDNRVTRLSTDKYFK